MIGNTNAAIQTAIAKGWKPNAYLSNMSMAYFAQGALHSDGFLPPDVIYSDAAQIIPDAGLYHFGVLTSNVYMAWTRIVCGRLKSDYQYSGSVVYNNFLWPKPTDEQKAKIAQTAQEIFDAREEACRKAVEKGENPRPLPTSIMRTLCHPSFAKPTKPTTRR